MMIMSHCIHYLDLDSKLFCQKVGRIELADVDQSSLLENLSLACSLDFKLVYIYDRVVSHTAATPVTSASVAAVRSSNANSTATVSSQSLMYSSIPGVLVDRKSTYVASIKQFDRALLCARAFEHNHFRIHRCPHTTDNTAMVSDCLKELAVESGVYSRFNTDESLSKEGFRAMFTMWLSNSLNRSLADEVFVIHDRLAGGGGAGEEELGFITVKKTTANIVNIGLLAVSASHRRKGLAHALLSRAVLWALEEVGGDPAAMLTVVTQGSNRPACECYEKFGFSLSSVQDIYHCWLPLHLPPSAAVMTPSSAAVMTPSSAAMMTPPSSAAMMTPPSSAVMMTPPPSAAVMTPPSTRLLHTTTATSSSSVLTPTEDHTPFRPIHIPFCKQHFTGNEAKYVHELLTPRGPGSGLDSSSSRFTDCCSSRVYQLLGSRPKQQVLMVPSGTAALELAALLSDLREGDEVIMPSYTFSSTANAFVLRGAVPVFVDIRADTLNIDESLIEGAITSRTKAVCVVHYRGVSCEMDAICSIVEKYGLILIEDAAQAFLSSYRGRPVGTFGHFGCFSFHYTKNIICGEGGALCINRQTNDIDPPHDTFERAAVVRDKGTNRTDFLAGKIDRYQWVDVGSSFVLSEASSAILFAQLECAPDITAKRLDLYACYQSSLKELEDTGLMQIPLVPDHCQHNGHIFCIILSSEESLLLYQRKLKALGIDSFAHYTPLHSSPAGIKFGRTNGPMTTTERVHKTLLRLPIWVDMTYDELNIVTRAVKTITAEVMDIN